ncbi:MAG: hypothetical protein QXJ18_05420 [Desulfurococcaceae archaeon]
MYVKNIDLQQCFEQALITASRNILLSELTPRELHVLYKGYATGYIVQPRKSGGLTPSRRLLEPLSQPLA